MSPRERKRYEALLSAELEAVRQRLFAKAEISKKSEGYLLGMVDGLCTSARCLGLTIRDKSDYDELAIPIAKRAEDYKTPPGVSVTVSTNAPGKKEAI